MNHVTKKKQFGAEILDWFDFRVDLLRVSNPW
jgi:hypothetical protein